MKSIGDGVVIRDVLVYCGIILHWGGDEEDDDMVLYWLRDDVSGGGIYRLFDRDGVYHGSVGENELRVRDGVDEEVVNRWVIVRVYSNDGYRVGCRIVGIDIGNGVLERLLEG